MAFPTGIAEVVLVKAGTKSGRVFRIDESSVCTENIRISGVAMTPSLYNYSTTATVRKQVFVPYSPSLTMLISLLPPTLLF